jgi:GNAT superfamily N-acetyltransferase
MTPPVQDYPTIRQALLNRGWTALDARTHPRSYVDAAGKRFGTLEKGGVRIALSLGHSLVEERGGVMVYQADNTTEAILQALIVDPEVRGKGLAKLVLKELTDCADATGTELYLEPVALDSGPLDTAALKRLYARFQFETPSLSSRIMVRSPGPRAP